MSFSSERQEPNLHDVVTSIESYLTYEKDEGAKNLEVDATTLSALSALQHAPQPAAPSSAPAEPIATPPVAPVLASGDVGQSLKAIADRIAKCTNCPLCNDRMNTVPGQGHARPEIAFVGEGPGAEEDKQGLAFVGRAGQLLTKIIAAMGYTRDEVWIGNIVKCRPPGNRTPLPDEMEACMPYLKEQLALLKPRVIVCLGATAVKGLLDTQQGITKIRGTWMMFEGIEVMPTFHPAYLLRNAAGKKDVWEDMKEVLRFLGREVPKSK